MRTALILLFVSALAHGYQLKHDRDGDVVSWGGALHFVIASQLDDQLHAPGATLAVQAAVATWASAMPNLQLTADPGDVKDSDSSVTVIDHDWPYDADVFAVTI